MLTGYNTDIRHGEIVLHVQTEDKGRENPAIESVIYIKGRVLAAKRTPYTKLLEEGKGEREIASLMEQQHRTILAAIRAGRFDPRITEALQGAATKTEAKGDGKAAARGDAKPAARGDGQPAAKRDGKTEGMVLTATSAPSGREAAAAPPPVSVKGAAQAEESGPSLDQVILQYLETEAEQEHLVLVLDGPEEIRPGRVSRLTLRAFSSKSGHPLAAVQISIRMLSTVSDPRTLLSGETGEGGELELELDVPSVQGGSAALIISGSSELGRAEIKQLL
jgi:hypothetical protein